MFDILKKIKCGKIAQAEHYQLSDKSLLQKCWLNVIRVETETEVQLKSHSSFLKHMCESTTAPSSQSLGNSLILVGLLWKMEDKLFTEGKIGYPSGGQRRKNNNCDSFPGCSDSGEKKKKRKNCVAYRMDTQ